MITAKVTLTQPFNAERQFVATTGSEHHMLLDDAAWASGPKPIELVAVGLAACTAFNVITILRQKYHQKVTGFEVRVERDRRIVRLACSKPCVSIVWSRAMKLIQWRSRKPYLSEEKYCSVGAMVKHTASQDTTTKSSRGNTMAEADSRASLEVRISGAPI